TIGVRSALLYKYFGQISHNFNHSHNRFMIIDDKDLYHFGASLKGLGKKWFGFSKMDVEVTKMLTRI
ncbi:MAG TPA: hypothetical protein VLJ60_07590, partial [bacterium]|nr:hypothetical protein [bacterium]